LAWVHPETSGSRSPSVFGKFEPSHGQTEKFVIDFGPDFFSDGLANDGKEWGLYEKREENEDGE
jgi:hypothetical protein